MKNTPNIVGVVTVRSGPRPLPGVWPEVQVQFGLLQAWFLGVWAETWQADEDPPRKVNAYVLDGYPTVGLNFAAGWGFAAGLDFTRGFEICSGCCKSPRRIR